MKGHFHDSEKLSQQQLIQILNLCFGNMPKSPVSFRPARFLTWAPVSAAALPTGMPGPPSPRRPRGTGHGKRLSASGRRQTLRQTLPELFLPEEPKSSGPRPRMRPGRHEPARSSSPVAGSGLVIGPQPWGGPRGSRHGRGAGCRGSDV